MINNCAQIQLAVTHGDLKLVKNIDANSKMIETIGIHIDFRSPEWDELTKNAIFIRNGIEPIAVPIIDGCATVPWEILDVDSDVHYEIGILGVGANGARLPTNKLRLRINAGCCVSTTIPKDPTPSVYDTIIDALHSLNNYSKDDIKEFVAEYCSENSVATKDWIEDQNYLTEHQDISGKVDKVAGKGLSTNDYDNAAKAKVDAIPIDPKYTDTIYDDTSIKNKVSSIETMLNTKQDIIADLVAIRNGAALGMTAIQSLDGYVKSDEIEQILSEILDAGRITEEGVDTNG